MVCRKDVCYTVTVLTAKYIKSLENISFTTSFGKHVTFPQRSGCSEFQRIARRENKAFFSDQCKEIEENNRMGKTRDLFKKIRDTKGTFYAKMGSIKDRNALDLTEAEDIKKRWQEYTELYKKDLHNQDSHDGMITH